MKRNFIKIYFLFAGLIVFTGPVLISSAMAAPSVSKSTVERAKETAKELVLKGRRTEALRTLSAAYASLATELELQAKLEKKTNSSQSSKNLLRTDLLRTWDEIATLFLSDKAQNQFALAESLWLTKPKEAVEILQSVTAMEIGNVSVAILGARAALRNSDCSRADTFAKDAEKIFAPNLEVRLVRLQVQSCLLGDQHSLPPLKIVSSESTPEWGELDSAIRLLIVRDLWRRKDVKGARAAVIAWETQAPEDPEVWYWKWKTSEPLALRNGAAGESTTGQDFATNRDRTERDRTAARNYLRICHEMSPRRRKLYSIHPELCLSTETVESDLKSSEKSGT